MQHRKCKVSLMLIAVLVLGMIFMVGANVRAAYIYQTSTTTGDIFRYDQDGNAAPSDGNAGAVFVNGVSGTVHHTALSSDGYMYFSTFYSGNAIHRADMTTGVVDDSWSMTGLSYVGALTFGSDGGLYAGVYGTGDIIKIDTATQSKTTIVSGQSANDIVFDGNGKMYVSTDAEVIRYNTSDWSKDSFSVAAGSGEYLYGLAYDAGKLYVSNYYNKVSRYDTDGTADGWVANTSGGARTYGVAIGPDGKLYADNAVGVVRFDTQSMTPVQEDFFSNPSGTTGYFVTWGAADAPVPEPSALLSLGLGLLGMAGYGIRRRSSLR